MANFVSFMEGLISLPLYIPGTAYYKCLQVNVFIDNGKLLVFVSTGVEHSTLGTNFIDKLLVISILLMEKLVFC